MMKRKRTRLFRTGGSWAVRIPREWVPASGEVVLRREGDRIIMEEEGSDLRELAARFASEGLLAFERPAQPVTPGTREL